MIRFSPSTPDCRSRWGVAPSPLAAALARIALGLFVSEALLAPAGLREADAACGVRDPREDIRFPYCDRITKLDIDVMNDDVEPPAAFNVNAVQVRAGEPLEFRVYALTGNPLTYYDVTYYTKAIRFRTHDFRKPTRLHYYEDSNNPRWVFTPRRERPEHSTGTLEVIFRCRKPGGTYATNLFVSVLPPAN